MMRIAIQGVGVVGGFGCGLEALSSALATKAVQTTEVCPVPGDESIRIPALLADTAPLERFVSKRATRRIDHFSRLALLGSHLAMQDAGELETTDRERLGIIIATGYGPTRTTFAFLDSVMDDGDICASPTHFSNSVHNAAAAHVAIQLKAGGPNLTVSQFEMSVPSALLAARQWLAEGRVDKILFGAVDEYCSVLGYCWERFFHASTSQPMRPLDLLQQSARVGEGAAFFVLTQDTCSRYGFIDEVGLERPESVLPQADGSTIFLLGADGHSCCGANYRRVLPAQARVAAYAPVYGSFPVGQSFDLAVAALALRDGRLPLVPDSGSASEGWDALQGGEPVESDLCCLKVDAQGYCGSLRLSRS